MGTNAKEERDRSKEQAHQDVATFLRKEATIEGAAMYDFKYEFRCGVYNSKKTQKKWNEFMGKYELSCSIPPGDCTNNCPVRVEDNIKRWLIYKNIPVEFECDGCGKDNEKYLCVLSREIYRILWNWDDNRRKVKVWNVDCYGKSNLNGINMGPDTMNSFSTTYNTVENKNDEELNIFAQKTHTIGNFVLVPAYFNPYRGTKAGIADYWDLSLNMMKNKSNIGTYKNGKFQVDIKWNNNEFRKYINTFFLWDYVSIDENDKTDYVVKSLFSECFSSENYSCSKQTDTHSEYMNERSESVISRDTEKKKYELQNFLNNVNWAIYRRGIFMVAMLRIAQIDNSTYEKLRSEVFVTDAAYNGYEDVFTKIRTQLNIADDSSVDASKSLNGVESVKEVINIAKKLICPSQKESSTK